MTPPIRAQEQWATANCSVQELSMRVRVQLAVCPHLGTSSGQVGENDDLFVALRCHGRKEWANVGRKWGAPADPSFIHDFHFISFASTSLKREKNIVYGACGA